MQVEEIFTSQVGAIDQFDSFKDFVVGFITRLFGFVHRKLEALEHTQCPVLVHVSGTRTIAERQLDRASSVAGEAQ